jgi:hypothetical protein
MKSRSKNTKVCFQGVGKIPGNNPFKSGATRKSAALESAVVIVLEYRLFSFWIPTLVGIALIPYLEHRTGTPSGPTDTERRDAR